MNLPKRPECFRQHGVIRCECSAWNPKERDSYIASRYLWSAAEVVAGMESNRQRREYLALVGSQRGPAAANQLRAAAMELMGIVA